MISSSTTQEYKPHACGRVLLTGVFAAIVGFVAVSPQSLWIDEAGSASKAMETTLTSFFGALLIDRSSDLQMPFYMFMLWGWEKLFGHSEFALRAMNIPLFTAALVLVARFWRADTLRLSFFIVFACSSAFLWAYLDEARPYILQFLGATACLVPLVNLAGGIPPASSSDVKLFTFGTLVLCGASLFGIVSAFWFSLAFLVLLLTKQPLPDILKRHDIKLSLVIALPLLVGLGVFYFWTLLNGARASSVGNTGIMNVAHSYYELIGMAGLGPGRGDLRSSAAAIMPFIPSLAAYACIVGLLIAFGAYLGWKYGNFSSDRRDWIVFWFVPVAVALSTFTVGVFGDFRVVGRHLTPILPFILVLFSMTSAALWRSPFPKTGRTITCLTVLAMLCSAVTYRQSDRHAKDDYRAAAAVGRDALARGDAVWWVANREGAVYYGLNVSSINSIESDRKVEPIAYCFMSPSLAVVAGFPTAQTVILSKTDIYDRYGSVRAMLENGGFRPTAHFTSFDVYSAVP